MLSTDCYQDSKILYPSHINYNFASFKPQLRPWYSYKAKILRTLHMTCFSMYWQAVQLFRHRLTARSGCLTYNLKWQPNAWNARLIWIEQISSLEAPSVNIYRKFSSVAWFLMRYLPVKHHKDKQIHMICVDHAINLFPLHSK